MAEIVAMATGKLTDKEVAQLVHGATYTRLEKNRASVVTFLCGCWVDINDGDDVCTQFLCSRHAGLDNLASYARIVIGLNTFVPLPSTALSRPKKEVFQEYDWMEGNYDRYFDAATQTQFTDTFDPEPVCQKLGAAIRRVLGPGLCHLVVTNHTPLFRRAYFRWDNYFYQYTFSIRSMTIFEKNDDRLELFVMPATEGFLKAKELNTTKDKEVMHYNEVMEAIIKKQGVMINHHSS